MTVRVLTGQQIGAGWSPALSVVKALAALALAQHCGGEAWYWMADEDHDRLEVASVVGLEGARLRRHRFRFEAPPETATGWLPWTEHHQQQAHALWGELPPSDEPTLRGHALALGRPLWHRGLRPFSPTHDADRFALQSVLESWRSRPLEPQLIAQFQRLTDAGHTPGLDPRQQAAWFALDPATGLRRRLEPSEPCPKGCWLSPGAAIRPLMQGLLTGATDVVLGPAERAYWRLTEPLWDIVALPPPRIHARPSLFVLPEGIHLSLPELDAVRDQRWEDLGSRDTWRAASCLHETPWRQEPDAALARAVAPAWRAFQAAVAKQERRHLRGQVATRLGMDPERLRQHLFPLEHPQERVLPGWLWLREEPLLTRMHQALRAWAAAVPQAAEPILL